MVLAQTQHGGDGARTRSEQFRTRSRPIPPEILYHYTSASGLQGILREGQIRATDARYLNDTTEFPIKIVIEEVQKEISLTVHLQRRTLLQNVLSCVHQSSPPEARAFVASLSEADDSLCHWLAYGDRGFGYALGFDWSPLPYNLGNKNFRVHLGKIDYDKDGWHDRCKFFLDNAISNVTAGIDDFWKGLLIQQTSDNLVRLAPCLKDRAFDVEREWRLYHVCFPGKEPSSGEKVTTLLKADRLIPYLNFNLKTESGGTRMRLREIVAGPHLNGADVRKSVTKLLQMCGYPTGDGGVQLRGSTIPYRP